MTTTSTLQHSTNSPEVVRVWRAQLRKKALQSLFAGSFGFLLAAAAVISKLVEGSPVRNTDFGWYAAVGTGGSLFGLAFLSGVVPAAFKLIMGPPAAGRSPETSLKKYYGHAVLGGRKPHQVVQAEALFFLHKSALEKVGGWDGFRKHWSEADRVIEGALQKKTRRAVGRFSLAKVEADRIGDYGVVAIIRFNTDDQKHEDEGPVSFSVLHEMIQEEGRWYLASAECSLKLVE